MTEFLQIHHSSVLVSDVGCALGFYVGILGMEVSDARPDLGFPGAWLKAGEQQLHLLELPNPDPVQGRPEHAGRDRHIAFMVRGLDELEQRLRQAGIVFTRSRSGRRAIFCHDPDGNGIELVEMSK